MIFVTGGAGFIGSNFIRDWLSESNEPVLNLDALTYAGNLASLEDYATDERYTFVHGSIGDTSLVNKLLLKYKPRAVLNFAAESHVDKSISAPEVFLNTNIIGTYKLLQAVREYLSNNPEKHSAFRFLHVSTDEVYGTLEKDMPAFTESHQYLPNSAYSASKAASDHLVRAWHHTYGVPVLTTNCSNNYGPYQFPEKLIPLIITNSLKGDDLPVYGDGLQIRDWLYVSDHCRAICKVLESGVPGETYNVGGNNEMTNLELVENICQLLDQRSPRSDGQKYSNQIKFVEDRLGHDRRYAIDNKKIEMKLGWKPLETFDSGIEKTVDWYLANSTWIDTVSESG